MDILTLELLKALEALQQEIHNAHLLNVKKYYSLCVADAQASKAIAIAKAAKEVS
jgi:hypothetical protein